MIPADQLQLWLMGAFPDQPGWTVGDRQTVHSFQQYMEHVTLVWPACDTTVELFVRVYRSYLSWWTLITPDLPQREQTAWNIAHRAGVPVAPILYRGRVADQEGAVIGRVPGASGWIPQSPMMVVHLADTLARLHSARVDPADQFHLPDCTLATLLARLRRWCDEIEANRLRQELDMMEVRLAHIVERSASLVHGDCHPGNILVDGGTVTAIIDWEEAALGDPRIDLCWLNAAIRHHDPALADEFLRTYEERVGYEVGDLQLWSEFLEVRYQIVHAWIKDALAHHRSLPSANPEAWPD